MRPTLLDPLHRFFPLDVGGHAPVLLADLSFKDRLPLPVIDFTVPGQGLRFSLVVCEHLARGEAHDAAAYRSEHPKLEAGQGYGRRAKTSRHKQRRRDWNLNQGSFLD